MARNEEGEFELILGNRQLLSVFFLMVLLLGLCFVGGYVLGRSAAPVLNATSQPVTAEETKPLVVASATPKQVEKEPPAAEPSPSQTAPQAAPEPKPEPVAKAAPAPKPEPPKPPAQKAAAKQAPASSQPIPGRVYLQLSATDKDKADTMVDLLRSRNLPGIASPIAEKPGLYRVLVGPMAEANVQTMRNQLKAAGFPADQAIKRVF